MDEHHSNYWPTWWEERGQKADLGTLDGQLLHGKTSPFDLFAGQELLYDWDKEFWDSRVDEYRKLNQLMEPIISVKPLTGDKLVLTTTMDHHAIAFFEISHVAYSD